MPCVVVSSLTKAADAVEANEADSVIAPFIVTDALLAAPLKDPDPDPVQPVNANPAFGVAWIPTDCPVLKKPLAGLTDPPALADMVRKYCCVKFAVYVAVTEFGTVMVCDIAPASLQLDQTKRAVLEAFCGLATAMV